MEHILPPDVDRLIEQLKSPDSGQRISAAAGLAGQDCRDEKVRLALEGAAWNDPDAYVRSEAKSSLGKLGFPIRPPDGWAPAEPAYIPPPQARAPDSDVKIHSQLQPISPFLTIWLKPRETIRKIVDTDPTKYVLLLAMISGVTQSLDNASRRNAGDSLPLIAILIICVIGGSIGGIISLYLGGALFSWSGSWFGGQATSEEVRAAIAWSSVPISFITLPVWILYLLIYGEEMFTISTPRMDTNPLLLVLISLPLSVILVIAGIWSLVLLVKCVGEVHRFSAWKALGALIAGVFVIGVLIFLVVIALSLCLSTIS